MPILFNKKNGIIVTYFNEDETEFIDTYTTLEKITSLHFSRLVHLIKNVLPQKQVNRDVQVVQDLIEAVEIVVDTKETAALINTVNSIVNYIDSNIKVYSTLDSDLNVALLVFKKEINKLLNIVLEN